MKFDLENIESEFIEDAKGGYTIPEGYFEQMEKDILNKTSYNGFKVPTDYFENASSELIKKVDSPKVIKHDFAFKQMAVGIAASILFIAGFFLFKDKSVTPLSTIAYSENKMNELSDEEIIYYVDIDDIKDSHINVAKAEDKLQKQEEEYILNNADEQQILEQL